MGCDIHVAIEEHTKDGWMPVRFLDPIKCRKTAENPVGYARPQITERNYDFFAALACVRGIGPAPKGYPDDINPATQRWLEHHGGEHSASWWPLDEFLRKYMATLWGPDKKTLGDATKKYPAADFLYLDRAEDDYTKFRAVFNFDS